MKKVTLAEFAEKMVSFDTKGRRLFNGHEQLFKERLRTGVRRQVQAVEASVRPDDEK
jgi:hypothetical protein